MGLGLGLGRGRGGADYHRTLPGLIRGPEIILNAFPQLGFVQPSDPKPLVTHILCELVSATPTHGAPNIVPMLSWLPIQMTDFSCALETPVCDVLDGDGCATVCLCLGRVQGDGGEGDCLSKEPGNAL